MLLTALTGFYLMFNFWNYAAGDFLEKHSRLFRNDFAKIPDIQRSTFSFIDVPLERTGGVISFALLNVLLLIFIITFNYEQFFENQQVVQNLSAETHERVNAVILSIVMAIGLIMFYFKGGFNFDAKAKTLKTLAIVWIVLNGILVLSAFAKNTEYIWQTGMLTYKRLGVYAFLILSLVGLFYTFFKIRNRKTNAFLFNRMFWWFFGTLLVCSWLNWGGIITHYNISCADFDVEYHLYNVEFNRNLLKKHADNNEALLEKINNQIWAEYFSNSRREQFLSKIIYYETVNYDAKNAANIPSAAN
ncbi:hypothetical protein FACS1894180_4260 [Bacteroidia bacterium]|nr:hypothetical protein FACS1894180_4260 [Bacteroidia bacterium]